MYSEHAGPTGDSNTPTFLVHWLSCTFTSIDAGLDAATSLFNVDCSQPGKGRYGYSKTCYSNGVTVSYGGNADTLYVELDGSACIEYARRNGFDSPSDWQRVVNELLYRKATIKRIDYALDDQVGLLSMDTILKHLHNRQYVCQFRKKKSSADFTRWIEEPESRCIRFGGRFSDFLVRIYDKTQEQASDGHHIRVEMASRGGRAQVLARAFATDGVSALSGHLLASLRFTDRHGKDSNRSRAKSAQWWLDFLGNIERARIRLPIKLEERDKRLLWFVLQVAPTAAQIREELGSEVFERLMADGLRRAMGKGGGAHLESA